MNYLHRNILRDSCKSIMLPLVAFFLKRGFRFDDLNQILKEAVVEAACKEAQSTATGKIANSKIEIATGLPRKAVSELRANQDKSNFKDEKSVPAGVVLKKWFNADNYLTSDGQPKRLEFESNRTGVSFVQLCKSVSLSLQPATILQELKRAGAVDELEDGKLQVSARSFIISPQDENVIKYFGIAGSNLLSTLLFNTDPKRSQQPYFERTAWASNLSEPTFHRFSGVVAETSKPFLELVDDWLVAHEVRDDEKGELRARSVIGVGIYVFKRSDSE